MKQILTGWLIDGTGKKAIKNAVIESKKGFVTSIKQYSKLNQIDLDLSSCTVIPGLVDAHVHMAMSGSLDTDFRKAQLELSSDTAKNLITANAKELLNYGVAAVRDGGDKYGFVERYLNDKVVSNRDSSSGISSPDILTPGMAWHAKGRYGGLIGRCPADSQSLGNAIKTAKGAKHVKIVNSGINSLVEFGKQTSPQFDFDELKTAIVVAKEMGLQVMVHANGEEPVKQSIEAGADSIEHGFFMGSDNLKRMADTGTIWVPTACTMKAYCESLDQQSNEADVAKRIWDEQLSLISKARQAGTNLAIGTDSGSMGVFHGKSIYIEIMAFIIAGFSIEEAISCSVKNGRDLCPGVNTGPLEKNAPLTFSAYDGSPEELSGMLQNCQNGLKALKEFYIFGQKII